MAFKIFMQVIAGDHLCLFFALCEDHSQIFMLLCITLHGISGARAVIHIAFIQEYTSRLDDLINILLSDMSAIHATKGVVCIHQMRRMSVKCFLFTWLKPIPPEGGIKNDNQQYY